MGFHMHRTSLGLQITPEEQGHKVVKLEPRQKGSGGKIQFYNEDHKNKGWVRVSGGQLTAFFKWHLKEMESPELRDHEVLTWNPTWSTFEPSKWAWNRLSADLWTSYLWLQIKPLLTGVLEQGRSLTGQKLGRMYRGLHVQKNISLMPPQCQASGS